MDTITTHKQYTVMLSKEESTVKLKWRTKKAGGGREEEHLAEGKMEFISVLRVGECCFG